MCKYRYVIVKIVIVLVLVCPLMAQEDEKVVQDILLGRFRRLQNLIANYKVTTEFHLPPGLEPKDVIQKKGSGFSIIDTGIRVEAKEFSVLENRALYDQHLDSWDRKIEHPDLDKISYIERRIDAFNPDRTEHLQIVRDSSTPHGVIYNNRALTDGDIDIGLGLRRYGDDVLLTEKDLKEMTIDELSNEHVILRDVPSEQSTHEWVFNRKLGYALTCYRRRLPRNNRINVEFIMNDFRNINGVILPFKVHGTVQTHMNDRKHIVRGYDIQVSEFKLNDNTNTSDRYRIKWPESTRIYDERSGIRFFIKNGNMIYVGDDDIYKMALDEVYKAQVNEPNNSASSPDANKPVEVVKVVEEKSVDLPVGDLVLSTKSDKSFSPFWKLAGGLVLAVIIVGFLAYRKRQDHLEG